MKGFCLWLLLLVLVLCKPGYAQQADSSLKADSPLSKRVIKLEEVEVHTDMAKYRKDSALQRVIYKKALKDAGSKPQKQLLVKPGEVGISLDGGVSALAMWVSGKKKKLKKFARMLEADEQERYINIRYNAGLVGRVINVDGEAAMAFVKTHPIPYDFVRAASDLEIKLWIREEYRKSNK